MTLTQFICYQEAATPPQHTNLPKTHKDKEKTPFKNHNSIIHECIIQSKSIFLYFKNKILFKYLNGKTDKTKL